MYTWKPMAFMESPLQSHPLSGKIWTKFTVGGHFMTATDHKRIVRVHSISLVL